MLNTAASAEYLSIPGFLKAMPREEAGKRIIYFEASNQNLDLQGEVILAKALAESADYYLKFGNVDIDHITMTGPKSGIADYNLFEIGRPVEVSVKSPATFVKAELYRGEGPAAEKANQVWDSLTQVSPAARWYPSVAGAVGGRAEKFDPATNSVVKYITKVRWTNVGVSRTPVNPTVSTLATVPFGAFVKCWGASGLDIAKALASGDVTDAGAMTGGQALAKQSLDRRVQSYWDFRDRLAGDLRAKRVPLDAAAIVAHSAKQYGIEKSVAADWFARFADDLKTVNPKGKLK